MQTLEECYRLIAESMFANIPEEWKEAWIDAEVEDNWGRYTGDYINLQGEGKWYDPEFRRKDLALLDVLLKIRGFMKQPGHAAWNRVHFRMTSEGDFNLQVKYPDSA
jgi:hypothetical protein